VCRGCAHLVGGRSALRILRYAHEANCLGSARRVSFRPEQDHRRRLSAHPGQRGTRWRHNCTIHGTHAGCVRRRPLERSPGTPSCTGSSRRTVERVGHHEAHRQPFAWHADIVGPPLRPANATRRSASRSVGSSTRRRRAGGSLRLVVRLPSPRQMRRFCRGHVTRPGPSEYSFTNVGERAEARPGGTGGALRHPPRNDSPRE